MENPGPSTTGNLPGAVQEGGGASPDDADFVSPSEAGINTTSAIWLYYKVKKNDVGLARCNLCFKTVFRGEGRGSTTTGLHRHLQSSHKIQHATLLKPESSNSGTSAQSTAKSTQPSLEETLNRNKTWDFYDPRAMEINYALGEMIALDIQPFSFVEDTGFLRLMKKLKPCYKVPGRKYFGETIVPDIFRRSSTKVRGQMNGDKWISITSDGWTATCRELVACGNVMEIQHASCFLHNLNLIIKDSINSQRTVIDMIKRSRAIAGHFHHSPIAAVKLQRIQTLLTIPKHAIPQDVQTRWNSTYKLLEGVLEQKRAIIMYGTEEDGITLLSPNEWNLLPAVVSILKPFEEMTKLLSGNDSVISDIIPTVAMLRQYLTMQDPTHNGILTLKSELLRSLNKRFEGIETMDYFTFATLLDPRYKDSCFSSANIEDMKTRLIQEIFDEEKSSRIPNVDSPDIRPGTSGSSAGPLTVLDSTHRTIWDCFDKIRSKRPRLEIAEAISEDESKKRAIKNDLDSFCNIELLPLFRPSEQDSDPETRKRNHPLAWWKQNESMFLAISKHVKKIFSAPPSSIASERVFSEAGIVYEDRRSRLLPENAERLIFLHHNLKKLNFDY